MSKPFMIRFPFKGRGCYANIYIQDTRLKEYHVHIIEPELHPGLPRKVVLTAVDGKLLLSEPINLSKTVLQLIIEEIEKKGF